MLNLSRFVWNLRCDIVIDIKCRKDTFENMVFGEPLIQSRWVKMARRDMALRDNQ